MSASTLTVTAIVAYPTNNPRFPIPTDLIVISARRVNSMVPNIITAAVALGIVVSDWSLHLPWEWRLLTARRRWKLSHIAYFASRFGGIGFCICTIIQSVLGNFNGGPRELGIDRWDYADFACRSDRRAALVFSTISIAGSTGILLLRCLALWRFHLAVMIPLGLLWIATPILTTVNIVNLPSTSRRNGLSACRSLPPQLHAHPILSSMPWFILPVFDSTILVLTLIGLHRATSRRRSSPLERMFRFDNIFYYAITVFTVIPIPIWYLIKGRDGRMMPYLNLYIGLSSVLSCRLFINLWKAIGRQLAQNTRNDNRNDYSSFSIDTSPIPSPHIVSRSVGPPGRSEISGQRTCLGEQVDNDDLDQDLSPSPATESKETNVSSNLSNLSIHPVSRKRIPDWVDVDPDIAFSLTDEYMLESMSEIESRGLHTTP